MGLREVARAQRTRALSALPLDRTADRRYLLSWTLAAASDLHHGLEQFAPRGGHRLSPRGIEASAITKAEPRVVAEEVGRAHRPVGSRHILRLVDQIWKGITELGRNSLHVLEGVFRVVAGVVRHDRH